MGYTRQNIIEKIEIAKENMQLFYKSDFINYRGNTLDTNEYYNEIICEWLLENLDLLNEIPTITREKWGFIFGVVAIVAAIVEMITEHNGTLLLCS